MVISSILEFVLVNQQLMPPLGMSVLRCIRLLRAFKVTRSAGHQPKCLYFAASASSGHSRSPGQQVTSQNVCTLLHSPPQGIQGHQVSRLPARISVLCCIRLLRAFKVTRSPGHQPEYLYFAVFASSWHSRSPGQQVTSQNVCTSLYLPPQGIQSPQVSRSPLTCRMSVLRCIHLHRPVKVTRSAGHHQNLYALLYSPPQSSEQSRSLGQQVTSGMSVLHPIHLIISGHQVPDAGHKHADYQSFAVSSSSGY